MVPAWRWTYPLGDLWFDHNTKKSDKGEALGQTLSPAQWVILSVWVPASLPMPSV